MYSKFSIVYKTFNCEQNFQYAVKKLFVLPHGVFLIFSKPEIDHRDHKPRS